jgi:hypothetical protein
MALGIKAGRRSEVWRQAVEGGVRAVLLRTLMRELADVEAVELKQDADGFGLKFAINEKVPWAFPEFADRCRDAAQASCSLEVEGGEEAAEGIERGDTLGQLLGRSFARRSDTPKRATARGASDHQQRPEGSSRQPAILDLINLTGELCHSIETRKQIHACLALQRDETKDETPLERRCGRRHEDRRQL